MNNFNLENSFKIGISKDVNKRSVGGRGSSHTIENAIKFKNLLNVHSMFGTHTKFILNF